MVAVSPYAEGNYAVFISYKRAFKFADGKSAASNLLTKVQGVLQSEAKVKDGAKDNILTWEEFYLFLSYRPNYQLALFGNVQITKE